jgi:hypothetical protein
VADHHPRSYQQCHPAAGLSDASATSERAEIIRRATALVKPTRAAHPRGAPIRKQFQEDVGHVLDQIELAEENRRVNRAKGSTKPKDVREPFRRVLLRAAQLAREQPGEIFLNWDNPGDIFSGRQNFLWHVEVTLDRFAIKRRGVPTAAAKEDTLPHPHSFFWMSTACRQMWKR